MIAKQVLDATRVDDVLAEFLSSVSFSGKVRDWRKLPEERDLAFNPDQPRDEQGQWTVTVGAVKKSKHGVYGKRLDSVDIITERGEGWEEKAHATALPILQARLPGLRITTEILGIKPYIKTLGGAGSGNYGHAGRPGVVGGSGPGTHPPETPEEAKTLLRALTGVQQVHVADTPHALRASQVVADTLYEMRRVGYKMPDSILITMTANPAGKTSHVMQGGKLISVDMEIDVPAFAPEDVPLDVLTKAAFGDDNMFVPRTFQDIVVHEMGHVQAGRRPGFAVSIHDFPEDVPGSNINTKGIYQAARKVSMYATENANEFLAETFTRMYRGDTLAPDSLKLYQALDGPEVRR